MRTTTIRPAHDPDLMARVLDQRRLPRREFIRTASGLVLLSSAELVLAGCPSEAQTEVVRVVILVFKAALEAFTRTDEIHGDVGFDNPSSQSIRFEGLTSLIEAFSNGIVTDRSEPKLYEVPPGGKSYGWGDLWATNVGPHFVNLLFGGDNVSTPPFDVRA
jgi:hypothetical protein